MNDLMLSVKGLTLSFGKGREARQVLHGVDLQLKRGQAFGLVGESGSGKTTVLRCLAGQYRHWEGRVAIDGIERSQQPGGVRIWREQPHHGQRVIGQASGPDPAVFQQLLALVLGDEPVHRYPLIRTKPPKSESAEPYRRV